MTNDVRLDGRKRGRSTIADVAERAGVHVSTASRALNPKALHRISSEVVRKIEKAADDLKYQPNTLASGLRTQKSGTIGLIVPALADPLYAAIIGAIEERVAEAGYITFVASSDYQGEKLHSIIERMARQYVDGLIVASFEINDPAVERCFDTGTPTVAVLRDPLHANMSSVVMDDVTGVQGLVEHVIDLGHRDIVYITPPVVASTVRNRLAGFMAGMQSEKALGCRFDVVEAVAYDVEAGRRIMERLLSGGLKSTAVIAFNDLVAVGCLIALKAAGVACPGDVSVAGINDLPFMNLLSPPLTTLHNAGRDLGSESAALLLSLIANKSQPVKRILLNSHVVVRETTARPKAER